MSKDYYSILGVSKNASQDDIKKAFRKLAHQHHPDKGTGDEKKFKEANEAYQILSDPEKRRQYDQFGKTFNSQGPSGGSGFGGFEGFDFGNFSQGGFQFSGGGGFEDIFSDIFSGGGFGATGRAKAGSDVQVDVEISFEEMVRGVKKEITLRKRNLCSDCGGVGGKKGSKEVSCSDCDGTGRIQKTVRTIFGAMSQATVCGRCRGKGKNFSEMCPSCHGDGRRIDTETITVSIPAGIENGQMLSVPGKGEAGEIGAPAGNLFIGIHVIPHDELKRRGADIVSKKAISFSLAALGGKTSVRTIDGDVTMKIPAGTQPGEVFRIRGKGIGSGHFDRGDHLVEITISVPKKLSSEEKRLIETLGKDLK